MIDIQVTLCFLSPVSHQPSSITLLYPSPYPHPLSTTPPSIYPYIHNRNHSYIVTSAHLRGRILGYFHSTSTFLPNSSSNYRISKPFHSASPKISPQKSSTRPLFCPNPSRFAVLLQSRYPKGKKEPKCLLKSARKYPTPYVFRSLAVYASCFR